MTDETQNSSDSAPSTNFTDFWEYGSKEVRRRAEEINRKLSIDVARIANFSEDIQTKSSASDLNLQEQGIEADREKTDLSN